MLKPEQEVRTVWFIQSASLRLSLTVENTLKLIKNHYIPSNKYLSDILENLVKRQRLNPGKIGGWQLPDLGNR